MKNGRVYKLGGSVIKGMLFKIGLESRLYDLGEATPSKGISEDTGMGGGKGSPVRRGAHGVQGKWWPLKQEKQVETRSWSFDLSPSTSLYWMPTVYSVWADRTRKEP